MSKKDFDVIQVHLKDSNLIEASAGTGKTYSIAILVVRLILEKQINLKEILMVTFTKVAVAELEVRIRKFIREAYAYAKHNSQIDETIKTIVDNQPDNEKVLTLLNNARRQLDETSIFTIHGFCQLTLTEFAFETGQNFNSEVIEDEASLINEAANLYWRKSITTLDSDFLTYLLKSGLSKDQLVNLLSKAKRGKQFIYNDKSTLKEYKSLKEQYENDLNDAINTFNLTFKQSPERTLGNIGESGHAYNAFATLTDDAEAFRNKLIEKQGANYANKKFPVLLQLALNVNDAANNLIKTGHDCNNFLYGQAIPFCNTYIEKQKQEQSLFAFDDLINKLHNSLSSESLQVAVRNKYKAVFIDEFQDTDQKQYEIFNTFFNGHSILFYIGDPKQSIYSFKGTDLDTYLDASDNVKHSFTMNKNYRSTEGYIKAMNKLFSAIDNPFQNTRIKYEPVHAGLSIPEITNSGHSVEPLSLYSCKNLTEVGTQTTNIVKELLLGDYKIKGRKIKPSDIGILVRANSKGKEIKSLLNEVNIPAITIDDSRVMESEQSTLLLYLLKAMHEPNTSNINRVLLTYLTNKKKGDLVLYENEADLAFFRQLNEIWKAKGVFCAINSFMEGYQTLNTIQDKFPSDAERIVTNILQITEILHNKENQSKSSPKELIHWIEFAIAGAEESGEYTQRLENDEEAVKIVTIHKSKGLAYNIVVAPYLDLKSEQDSKWDFVEYKDPEKNQYCFSADITDEACRLYSIQAEQENRRLIYVTLTRAVYMGIIIHKPKDKCGIKHFIDGAIKKQYFDYKESLETNDLLYNNLVEEINKTPRNYSTTQVKATWNSYSFSRLSLYEPHEMPEPIALSDDYDKFIFNELPKGALAGNFLHYLFENIDFSVSNYTTGIDKAIKRYGSVFKNVDNKLKENLSAMINQVLNAKISENGSFNLANIKQANKLNEMGFNYAIDEFTTQRLHDLIPNIDFNREGEIQGMMNGFIDLLFEHEGRFFILDWKSNYLGNSLEYYMPDKLEHAVQESNYHLQYLIYTIALIRYLKQVLPNFEYDKHFGGVYYIFLRGCRAGENTGIFYDKPEQELIEKLEDIFTKSPATT